MSKKLFVYVDIVIILFETIYQICVTQYCNGQYEKPLVYKLVKYNSYSKKSVLARKYVPNVNKCKEFAIEKRALAFNYGQYESFNDILDDDSNDPFNVNCILLTCPEINNFTALANVNGFDYYSAFYKKIWLGGNRTLSCIPTAGLFMISDDKLNYTDARKSCQNLNGSLAHIASEIRTNHLAAIIGDRTSAYVGLRSEKGERTWKNECNEPLSCFYYRAWGVGEPSRTSGCTVLTRIDLKSFPFWEVVPCNQELRYICEFDAKYHRPKWTNNEILPNCKTNIASQIWQFFGGLSTTSNFYIKY